MIDTQELLRDFEPISLKEMDAVALLNRTDSKFVFSVGDLREVIEGVKNKGYKVLEINGKRAALYKTTYFDTPDLKFYHQHQSGKTNRIKVRCRKYVDSGICFLEKKLKNNKGRTIKTRIRVPDFVNEITEEHRQQLQIDKDLQLEQTQWNTFSRITLVNHELKERVTIDIGLHFQLNGKNEELNNTIICEVKQDGVNHFSPIIRALKNSHIRPMRISKYCIGTVLLRDDVKYNNFKRKLLKINKLENELAA